VKERWHIDERLLVLQDIENETAKITCRKPVPMRSKDFKDKTIGSFSRIENITYISIKYLSSNKRQDHLDVIDTIVHECRHAYQWSNITDKRIELNDNNEIDNDLIDDWRENFKNYLDKETYGDDVYRNQPVEYDSFAFSRDVMTFVSLKE